MKIKAIVERNDNNFYAITCEDVIAGCHFGGYGYSAQEAKTDFMEGIKESQKKLRLSSATTSPHSSIISTG